MRVFLVSSWLLACFIALSAPCMTQNVSGQDDVWQWQLKKMEEVVRSQQEQINSMRSSIKSIEAIEAPKKGDNDFRAYWDKGLRFESGNGNFKLKIGGVVMNDWGWFTQDSKIERSSIGDQTDGTEFRRSRIYLEGDIYKNIGFKAQYDFASGGRPDFKDVYMELQKIPYFGNFRVGHFKEPFSLEELTSSTYITFMERSLNNVFVPSRNTGFMLHNHMLDERMTWAGGVFRNASEHGDSEGNKKTEGGYSFSGRITALPWYEEKGKRLLHVGLSYSRQNAFENSVRFRETPEMHMADRFVDTGAFGAENYDIINPELALVYGPFSLQTEYTFADVELENSTNPDPDFSGYYVSGSYFLTGESRKYKTKNGVFDRVTPNDNFSLEKGAGAIELVARYSHLDLSDESIRGGRLNDVTLGINWYLNPNTRVMLNYVNADVTRLVGSTRLSDDSANLFGIRFQIDF